MRSGMKVIFITREGYSLSGARVRCYRFADALKRYGMDTEVFSFAEHLGARYGEKESEMSFLEKMRYNIRALQALARKEKEAVFFVQRLNYHALAPFLVSLKRGNRLIFDCDDWNIRENPLYYFGFFPSSKMEFLTRKLAKYACLCTAASSFLETYLSQFNSRVYYVPTGVDTDAFKPKSDHADGQNITFSWIGTVYHQEMKENVAFIVECFLALAGKYKNIILRLAGEGRFIQHIAAYVNNSKYTDRIIMDPWIHPDKIPAYLSDMDIGLLPLIQDTKFNKAKSPTKLFEFMAMTKPVVSSNIGEPAHIIQDGKNGLLARSKEEFLAKMEMLINDNRLRKSLGDSARKTIEEKYSLHILSKRLYEIVSSIEDSRTTAHRR